jgi:hypothetical protein
MTRCVSLGFRHRHGLKFIRQNAGFLVKTALLPTAVDPSLSGKVKRIRTWLTRLCAVCLILLIQGPAMLVQEVAWAGMLVSYSRDRGFDRGVVETFDGNHPCKMCAKAAELRKKEHQPDPQSPQREKVPVRFTWGDMVSHSCRVMVPNASERDCCLTPAAAVPPMLGRDMDSPVVPPPEAV